MCTGLAIEHSEPLNSGSLLNRRILAGGKGGNVGRLREWKVWNGLGLTNRLLHCVSGTFPFYTHPLTLIWDGQ